MTDFVAISLGPARQISHRVLVAAPACAGWTQAEGLLGALAHQRIFASEFFIVLPDGGEAETVAWVKLLRLLGMNPRHARVFTAAVARHAGIASLAAWLQPWLICLVAMPEPEAGALREEIIARAARCRREPQVTLAPVAQGETALSCREFLHQLQDPRWVGRQLAGAQAGRDRLARHILGRGPADAEGFCARAAALLAEDAAFAQQLLAAGRRRMEELAQRNRYLVTMAAGEGGANG